MTSIELQLRDLRDLLKTKIENKFNVTCTSTTILGLIRELNDLCENNNLYINEANADEIDDTLIEDVPIFIHTPLGSLANRIITSANYLSEILNKTGVNANVNDGFTTLINKIDNITVIHKITPNIILTSLSTYASGKTASLIAKVTGNDDYGTPTGIVEFYENSSNTPFTTANVINGKATGLRKHTVASTTSYTFYARYISDNDYYNDTEKSEAITVTWTLKNI